MGLGLKIPFRLQYGGGGVITFIGTAPDQVVYFEMVAIDPVEGHGPWAPCGSLRWQYRKTDKTHRATNIYIAPTHRPMIRFGMGYKFGEVVFGQELDLHDRLTVRAVLD